MKKPAASEHTVDNTEEHSDATDSTQTPTAKRPRIGKLHPRYTGLVFSFYMACIMALLMCTFVTALNTGIGGDFIARVIHAYIFSMPIAFFCVLAVRPLVLFLVSKTVRHH